MRVRKTGRKQTFNTLRMCREVANNAPATETVDNVGGAISSVGVITVNHCHLV